MPHARVTIKLVRANGFAANLRNKFNVKAEECVFIDDKPENIEGCKAVGMSGIVFKNSNQLKQELDKILR